MEEKKRRELSLDEMDKVSGGSHLDEDGYWIFDVEKCEECGGDYIINFYSQGIYDLVCKKCGCRALA